jgi:hypothetical protein
MSRIISCGWTSAAISDAAILTGLAKTRTRRYWQDSYAMRFVAGQYVDLWSRSPRVKGAYFIRTVTLARDPFKQPLTDLTYDDFKLEGFAYLVKHDPHGMLNLLEHLFPQGDEELYRIVRQGDRWHEKLPTAVIDAWRRQPGVPWVVDWALA